MPRNHTRLSVCIYAGLIAACLLVAAPGMAQAGRGYYHPDLLRRQFNQYDTNRDGALSPQEASVFRWPFAEIDTDSDGGITLIEADAYLRRVTAGGNRTPRRGAQATDPYAEAPFRRHRDIAYAPQIEPNNERLMLDLYTPRHDVAHDEWNAKHGTRPIVVWVHGGAWAIGDKALVGLKMPMFTSRGCLFASINYRFVPEGLHPVNADDVARAVAWLIEHAEEYGGDPERIVLIGHSAGAHLVSLVGANPAHLEAAGVDPAAVKAVVSLDTQAYDIPRLMDGVAPVARRLYINAFTNDAELWAAASPITHIGSGRSSAYPDFLLLSAGGDEGRISQAQAFANKLEEAGTTARHIDYPDHTHATINRTLGRTGQQTTSDVIGFPDSLFADPAED